MMKVEDARSEDPRTRDVHSADIPDGFFLGINGALWFKDSEGIVLIDARGNKHLMQRVPLRGYPSTWVRPQPVHGVIRIERNA